MGIDYFEILSSNCAEQRNRKKFISTRVQNYSFMLIDRKFLKEVFAER